MRLRLAFSLALLAAPASLAAQTAALAPAPNPGVEVTGRVVDAATGAPVSQAVVELKDARRKALTGADGRFRLTNVPPGTHQWVITRIGYAAWDESTEVADGDDFSIALLARPEVLQGITVVSSRLTQRRESMGVRVETLDMGTLRRSAAPSAAGAVRDHLGLNGVPCNNIDQGGPSCAWVRGELVPVAVFIDEQRAPGGLADLEYLLPQELYAVEAYSGGAMVRVFTIGFAESLARGRASLLPIRY